MRNLPFRFALTPSLARKWQQLSTSQQQQLYDQFRHEGIEQVDLEAKRFTDEAYVQNRFAEASEAAACLDLRLDVYALCFSHYVSKQLRKGKPVLGEVELAEQWAKSTGLRYQLEQVCAVGRIDIVFEDEYLVVEAKFADGFKHAIGQALSYRECYRIAKGAHWQAGVLLLGRRLDCDFRTIERICNNLNVKVFWHHELSTDLRQANC